MGYQREERGGEGRGERRGGEGRGEGEERRGERRMCVYVCACTCESRAGSLCSILQQCPSPGDLSCLPPSLPPGHLYAEHFGHVSLVTFCQNSLGASFGLAHRCPPLSHGPSTLPSAGPAPSVPPSRSVVHESGLWSAAHLASIEAPGLGSWDLRQAADPPEVLFPHS